MFTRIKDPELRTFRDLVTVSLKEAQRAIDEIEAHRLR